MGTSILIKMGNCCSAEGKHLDLDGEVCPAEEKNMAVDN